MSPKKTIIITALVISTCIAMIGYKYLQPSLGQDDNVVIQYREHKGDKNNNNHNQNKHEGHKSNQHNTNKQSRGQKPSKHEPEKNKKKSYSRESQEFVKLYNNTSKEERSSGKSNETFESYNKLSKDQKNEVREQLYDKRLSDYISEFFNVNSKLYEGASESKMNETTKELHKSFKKFNDRNKSKNSPKFIKTDVIKKFITFVDKIPNKKSEENKKDRSDKIEKAYEAYKKLYSAYKKHLKVTESENRDIKKAAVKLFDFKNIEHMVWYGHETDESRNDHNEKSSK